MATRNSHRRQRVRDGEVKTGTFVKRAEALPSLLAANVWQRIRPRERLK